MCRNECMVPVYRSAGFINFNKCSFIVFDFNYFGFNFIFSGGFFYPHTLVKFSILLDNGVEKLLCLFHRYLVTENIYNHNPCFGYVAWNLFTVALFLFRSFSVSINIFIKIRIWRVFKNFTVVILIYRLGWFRFWFGIRFILFATLAVNSFVCQLDVGYCGIWQLLLQLFYHQF